MEVTIFNTYVVYSKNNGIRGLPSEGKIFVGENAKNNAEKFKNEMGNEFEVGSLWKYLNE